MGGIPSLTPEHPPLAARERGAWAGLLRDLFGHLPFRALAINPTWLAWHDGAVVGLARSTYEKWQLPECTLEGARLAVLADALEEAGCADEEILGHLRRNGPHVRGCWVVDALLGKT